MGKHKHKKSTQSVNTLATVDQAELTLTSEPIEIIPKKQLQNLIDENKQLRIRVAELTKDKNILHEHLELKTHEYNALKEENTRLKEKINMLEKRVDDLTKIINQQQTEKYYRKILVAVIDLVEDENIILDDINDDRGWDGIIQSMNSERIGECHYIDKNPRYENQASKNYKKNIFINKLETLSTDVKELFEVSYGGILNRILKYLKTQNYPVSESDVIKYSKRTKFWN
jgi:hypothetical protein